MEELAGTGSVAVAVGIAAALGFIGLGATIHTKHVERLSSLPYAELVYGLIVSINQISFCSVLTFELLIFFSL